MSEEEGVSDVIVILGMIGSVLDCVLCAIYLFITALNWKILTSNIIQILNLSFIVASIVIAISFFLPEYSSDDFDIKHPPLLCKFQAIFTTAGLITGNFSILAEIIAIYLTFAYNEVVEAFSFWLKIGFISFAWIFTVIYELIVIFKNEYVAANESLECLPTDSLLNLYMRGMTIEILVSFVFLCVVGYKMWKQIKENLKNDDEAEEQGKRYKSLFYRCLICHIYSSVFMICDFIVTLYNEEDSDGIWFKIANVIDYIGYAFFGVVYLLLIVFNDYIWELYKRLFGCGNKVEEEDEDGKLETAMQNFEGELYGKTSLKDLQDREFS